MPLRIYSDTTQPVLNGLAPESKKKSAGSTGADTAARPVCSKTMKTLAEQHMQSKTAMSFFCINGAQDDAGKFTFRSTKHTIITGGVGAKAEALNKTAELHNLQDADTVAFELQTSTTSRDWSLEPGRETRCGLLSTFARTATGVPALDDGETVWHATGCASTSPQQDRILETSSATSGSRLHPATTREFSCSTLQRRPS